MVYSGLVRTRIAFITGENCHIMFESGLAASANSIVTLRKRPSWVKNSDSWLKSLLSRNLQKHPIVSDQKTLGGTGFDLGFIYLPTGLRPSATDIVVPDWNCWDNSLPNHFFNISKQYLSDDGFLAVLHSGEFIHTSSIYSAAQSRGLFKPVQSYTILLPSPLWKGNNDIQVISKPIYCKRSSPSMFVQSFCFHPLNHVLMTQQIVNSGV